MLNKINQLTITISGNIFLAGFRSFVEELSLKYDIAGFVYNDFRDNTVKFVCEGEVSKIERFVEEIKKYPDLKVEVQNKIILPKPAGRVVIGIEREIFDRLDLGVLHLASIDERLASIDKTLKENTGMLKENTNVLKENTGILKDIKNILQKIAEK